MHIPALSKVLANPSLENVRVGVAQAQRVRSHDLSRGTSPCYDSTKLYEVQGNQEKGGNMVHE
jgi:hypothetical protein